MENQIGAEEKNIVINSEVFQTKNVQPTTEAGKGFVYDSSIIDNQENAWLNWPLVQMTSTGNEQKFVEYW